MKNFVTNLLLIGCVLIALTFALLGCGAPPCDLGALGNDPGVLHRSEVASHYQTAAPPLGDPPACGGSEQAPLQCVGADFGYLAEQGFKITKVTPHYEDPTSDVLWVDQDGRFWRQHKY